jgi:ribosome-associated toxin RatA of RatAB toxin-antitoxin module
MATLNKSIIINASVEKVFKYTTDQSNLPEIWPSLIENKVVERLPNGGTKAQFVYKMAGMRFEGISIDTEFIPNQRVVSKTEEGVQSEMTWEYQSEGEATKVNFRVEYTVPIPLLGKLAEAFIVKQNEHEAETLLANLKARMEA